MTEVRIRSDGMSIDDGSLVVRHVWPITYINRT